MHFLWEWMDSLQYNEYAFWGAFGFRKSTKMLQLEITIIFLNLSNANIHELSYFNIGMGLIAIRVDPLFMTELMDFYI